MKHLNYEQLAMEAHLSDCVEWRSVLSSSSP